jgi:hypothetical protein
MSRRALAHLPTRRLRPLPPEIAAETLTHLIRLSPGAAAYHAAAGNAYDYAGTLVVASRDGRGSSPVSTVHFADPAVLELDARGLLVALGAELPAPRLSVRSAPRPAAGADRLRFVQHIAERHVAPVAIVNPDDVTTAIATTREEFSFAGAIAHRARLDAAGFGDPAQSMTLVVRRRDQLAGHLTWSITIDDLDRRRRADVIAMAVVTDSGRRECAAALFAAMARHASRVPALVMRIAVDSPEPDRDLAHLVAAGWTHACTRRGLDPWLPATG